MACALCVSGAPPTIASLHPLIGSCRLDPAPPAMATRGAFTTTAPERLIQSLRRNAAYSFLGRLHPETPRRPARSTELLLQRLQLAQIWMPESSSPRYQLPRTRCCGAYISSARSNQQLEIACQRPPEPPQPNLGHRLRPQSRQCHQSIIRLGVVVCAYAGREIFAAKQFDIWAVTS